MDQTYWDIRIGERQKFNIFEMKCLRRMMGVTRMEREKNEVIRRRTGVKTELECRVDRNDLKWSGYMKRMVYKCLRKKVMRASVSGTAIRGRPRFG